MPQIVDDEEHFWQEPLGAWIKDCVSGCDALIPESTWRAEERRETVLRFAELCDGFVFNLLFVFVDTDSLNLVVMQDGRIAVADMATRMKHFSTLIHNIYHFYRVRFRSKHFSS
ncbi:unnamed protein product [Toxocara canis]|uniref:PI3K/PI4K domain-containing protein n=1 Tax=Toxocara canis TaxID=6265 RepID=A0A183U2C3_TOXCA|nr:unnamed protein product [Toxocara canis]